MRLRTQLLIGFAPVLLFMLLMAWVGHQSKQTLLDRQESTRQVYQAIDALRQLEAGVLGLQIAAQEAGAATGEGKERLAAYKLAQLRLHKLLAKDSRQSERLALVDSLVQTWLAAAPATPGNHVALRDVQNQIGMMIETERDSLDRHRQAMMETVQRTDLLESGGAALVIVLTIGLMLALLRKTQAIVGADPVELAAAAERYARGDMSSPLPGQSGLAASVQEMAATLQDAAAQARTIATGDFSADIRPRSEQDELGLALQNMTRTLRDIGQVAEQVADGDLDIQVESKGKQDYLAQSMNRMIASLKDAARQANLVAVGNYSTDIAPRSGKDELGMALQRMSTNLRAAHEDMQARDWLKDGIARISDALRGDPDLTPLVNKALTEIANTLGARMGALYLTKGSDVTLLTLASSYAFTSRKNLSSQFRLGEGLVGQAALEQQPIMISNVPEDYVRITSALGERVPSFICVTPILYENRLKGVIEIGTLGELPPASLEYLLQASNQLAIAIEGAQARENQANLLEEAQRLTEELQTQQEELRSANEELEEQTQRLTLSEDLLKRQQEELKVSNEELEEKNELLERQKREVERARKDISVKADELALASKYKSEFLANMSHELRTPLNSLLLLAQSLVQNRPGNLTADQVESAKVILGSGSDLLNLINEILDLSKIEAGRMDLQLGKVYLDDLADGIRASFGHMAEDKGLSLDIAIDPDLPAEISSDRKRLDQILRNLMSNALKFTADGGVSVHFTRPAAETDLSRSGLGNEASLAIAITDTGIGIPADKHKLIFEAFQQADGTTTRQYGGTGLGLTISREMAALLGGEIQLSSEPGRGSTFTLYLPVAAAVSAPRTGAEPTRLPPAVTAAVSGSAAPHRHAGVADDRDDLGDASKAILVIEDDPKFAAILVGICHEKGFKCIATASGEEGLALATRLRPSAVILDVMLPGMDGMAVLTALKADIHTRHIPVHVVSVIDQPVEALRHGAVGYTVKPLNRANLDEIFHTLAQMADNRTKRLLVVEDDPQARQEIVALIGNGDVVSDQAESGEQAMQALRSQHYDCVILDLKLPDMNGRELLATLEREGVALPPIIVHTARSLSADEEMDLRQHTESIIIKDVRSPERLLDEVSLFLHRVVSNLPEKQRAIIHNLHDSDAPLRGKKVLIVDDDMRTMFAISRLLSERGLETFKAGNGERALAMLAEQPDVDVVLMDIMMPVMDGYEAMKQIRAQDRYRKLPIIALTAKAMPEDRQKCLAAGASDYLPKPVDAGRLFSLLRVWLYG